MLGILQVIQLFQKKEENSNYVTLSLKLSFKFVLLKYSLYSFLPQNILTAKEGN